LPAKKEERRAALARLRDERDTWVVFDAPYRLSALLDDLQRTLGAERRVVVACNLTMPDEKIVRGTLKQVVHHFEKNPFKGEFVIVIAGKTNSLS
jgi:16S rRNA (cytidine1402-2'-O)-methyltransferase